MSPSRSRTISAVVKPPPLFSADTRRRYKTWLAWAGLTLLYALLISHQIRRVLWYDELITFYISKAPTLTELMRLMGRWDLTPPTLHLLARASMSLFGENPIALRLPSVLEFYLASLMIFGYARRKLGTEYGLLSVLLLWYSPFFQYATEARPYALLAMFFAALLLVRRACNRLLVPAYPHCRTFLEFWQAESSMAPSFRGTSCQRWLASACSRAWRRRRAFQGLESRLF